MAFPVGMLITHAKYFTVGPNNLAGENFPTVAMGEKRIFETEENEGRENDKPEAQKDNDTK